MLSTLCRPFGRRLHQAGKRAFASKTKLRVCELEGDGIGPEIQRSVHEVASAITDLSNVEFEFIPIDWSVITREADTKHTYIDKAFEVMDETKLALKYPTVTQTRSPNALIRRKCDFSVIYRPAISIDGINSNFKKDVNMHIVRIATGGTYEDPGQMLGTHSAVSIRLVERLPCLQAANFSFRLAEKKGLTMTSTSKYTIQRVTDGLFESTAREVARSFPTVSHQVELFDALLGKVILDPTQYQVVLCLNEYGDFLSDMASGLVGSLGTGASGNYSFREDLEVNHAMFDPAGGTAPDIAGKNLANPTAMLLAFGMMLDHVDRYDLGHALRLSLLECIRKGETTKDLRGKLSTTDFTQKVISLMKGHLPDSDDD